MTDSNPYQAPESRVDFPGAETCQPKIFSLTGRLGRLRYLAYISGMNIMLYLAMGVIFGGSIAVNSGQPDVATGIGSLATLALYLASFVFTFLFAKRRLNDLNRTGWFVLLFFVPLVNLLLLIYLVFFPGTYGGNDYGPEPAANTLGVKLLGLLLPLLFITGILAAIIIPAYQDYVMQARQTPIETR
jgi:uncharacterized membrane protein YhaH (DUF805 family)